jgi:transcriptional regulator with XRE-family HTH domain
MEQDRLFLRGFAARLKAIRITRGLTQEGLADRAGMSVKHVSEMERVLTEPSLTAVARLAKALGVRIADLLVEKESAAKAPALETEHTQLVEAGREMSKMAKKMLELGRRLDDVRRSTPGRSSKRTSRSARKKKASR